MPNDSFFSKTLSVLSSEDAEMSKHTQVFLQESAALLAELTRQQAAKRGLTIHSPLKPEAIEDLIYVMSQYYVLIQNSGRAPTHLRNTKRPPISAMLRIVQGSGFHLAAGQSQAQAAYILARAIAKHGSKRRRFVPPTLRAFKKAIDPILQKWYDKIFNSLKLKEETLNL